MRRILAPLLVLLVVAVLAGLYYYAQSPPVVEPPSVVEPVETPTAISMPANATPATVNYVHDGDTIFLTTPADPNLKVRLLAVDTPEVGDNAECYGDAARDHLRALLPEGATVYTLADVSPLDQYGRSLLFVWTESEELVNYSLVTSGMAEAVFIGQNTRYDNEFEAAEDAAMDAGAGFWGSC